ncbi:radical SAM protein [Candidatus Woesearchaeota archaeon]|nr:radical SAM protein [Candidatus Woesearchaeota archaeon]
MATRCRLKCILNGPLKDPLKENRFFSVNRGILAKGCQYCVRGTKLVLFVTGLCPRRCYFCPVSDEKYGKDAVFANERPVGKDEDVIAEAEMMGALGAGITGGDPLARVERTAHYIRLLKERFGKKFHIHLYTSLVLANEQKLRLLFDAGLDEIRFHPDLDRPEHWGRIMIARKFPWSLGIEIPSLPAKKNETEKALEFMSGRVDFVNINELEMADNSLSKLGERGYTTRNALTYAVNGSREMALEMMQLLFKKTPRLPIHFCTAKLKDRVQLGNRIKRESKNARKSFDSVDEDGLLRRGALYLPSLAPGAGYRRKLRGQKEHGGGERMVKTLSMAAEHISAKFRIDKNDIFVDEKKPRILMSEANLRKLAKDFLNLGLVPAVVTEYPTDDQIEIEVEMVSYLAFARVSSLKIVNIFSVC